MRAHAVTPRAATAPPPRPARAARTPRSALGARSVRRRALDGDGGVGVEPAVLDPPPLVAEEGASGVDEFEASSSGDDRSPRADATPEASTNPGLPAWARGVAVSVAASAVVALGAAVPSGSIVASSPAHSTGAPAGSTCGDFSARRTRVAREILTCNQENWETNCLAHYSDDLRYVDGPGLTNVRGKDAMATYLRNQFAFSNQWLTVTDETCAADTYVATWSLDMDLGTGNLVDMPGISVLKFGDGDGDADADGTGAELVRYHRDYLPDGKIWEQAPVVGPLVKFQRETYVGCMMSPRGCADLLGAPK